RRARRTIRPWACRPSMPFSIAPGPRWPACDFRLYSAARMPEVRKTIHLVSLGCVKNRVDSEVLPGTAEQAGVSHVDRADDAEIIVVNSCGFIGEAKKESIETIFEMASFKERGSCQKLVVAGCLSQRHPAELAAEMPEVDHFLGSSDMLGLRTVLTGKGERMMVGDPASWLL